MRNISIEETSMVCLLKAKSFVPLYTTARYFPRDIDSLHTISYTYTVLFGQGYGSGGGFYT